MISVFSPDSRAYYAVKTLDALVYVFLPQLMMLLLRLLQRRPLLHRMVGRSVLIGDCPWVAQCVEAFASKLFACSYSATAVAVASANPADHLVHRHTHRVVRGGLLAVGRPDGRLSALTTLESTVCLAANQVRARRRGRPIMRSRCRARLFAHIRRALSLSRRRRASSRSG